MGFEIKTWHVLEKYTEESDMTEITVPDGVNEIGEGAFCGCKQVKKIILPDSVEKISDSAFSFRSLEEIHIPDSVTEIGEEAFYETALKKVVLPKHLKVIADRLFHECRKLEEVVIPEGVERIEGEAFFLTGLKEVHIPESVKTIRGWAFGGHYAPVLVFHKNQRITKIKVLGIWDDNAPEQRLMKFFEQPSAENFSALKAEYKFPVAYSYYDIADEISAYLKRNIKEAVHLAINQNQPEVLKGILERELIIKKHIDELIQYAIDNTQKGRNPEFQVMLTDYKYQHFPADTNRITKKLKL
ncbi:MAG: leucine-rich repeat domain-containing protein [Oscillospiraceae bacterium]|nr:leucine-rich repeat domain-containing protein [Oscillospiraceae bacterium]